MNKRFVLSLALALSAAPEASGGGILIDHNDTDITALTPAAMQKAKDELHIAYGHTSHGSQLTTGMDGLVDFADGGGGGLSLPTGFFAWNDGGTDGALDLRDGFRPGDLGNPDRTAWAESTRDYLEMPENGDVNVIIWSWCGQADTTKENIDLYLNTMSELERDYPDVRFVYMTGHLVGSGLEGNLHQRNQQIRDYCLANDKILYDFADIETYDPDGTYFGDRYPDDNCDYDEDGELPRTETGNWAVEWQSSHVEGVDWYECGSAHSQPLNANQKAYAAWALWTEIASLPEPASPLLHLTSLLALSVIARGRASRDHPQV